MLKQTILVTSLLLAASQAQAEEESSWFSSALNFLGLDAEKTEENIQPMPRGGSRNSVR